MVASFAGRSEQLKAIIHNQSKGIFQLADERIVHFTYCEFADQRVFGAEIYDKDLNRIGYSTIQKIPIEKSKKKFIPWMVAAKDSKDKFYIIDRNDGRKVKVVKFSFE